MTVSLLLLCRVFCHDFRERRLCDNKQYTGGQDDNSSSAHQSRIRGQDSKNSVIHKARWSDPATGPGRQLHKD